MKEIEKTEGERNNDTAGTIYMFMCMSARDLSVDPPINNLTYTMYRNNDGKPKAKLKAAEARSILPVLVHEMTVFFPPRSDRDHLRLQCLVSIDNFYKELVQWRSTWG